MRRQGRAVVSPHVRIVPVPGKTKLNSQPRLGFRTTGARMERLRVFSTVRARLVALGVGAITISFLLFGAFAYAMFSHSLWNRFDEGLEATVDTLTTAFATGIRVEKGDELEAAHHLLNELRFPNRRIGIHTLDGKPFPQVSTKPDDPHHAHGPAIQLSESEISSLAHANRLDIDVTSFVRLTHETLEGETRLAIKGFESPSSGTRYLIAAEQPTAEIVTTLSLLRNALLIAVPILLVFTFAAGWFLAERSLAPIAAMTQRARTIGEKNLDARLPIANERDEFGELALVFNELLDRLERAFGQLEGAFGQMRQFLADASHELRTPLAAVRGEVQVALKRPRSSEEYQESLVVIHEEALHMSRIVEDLFMLARADAGERPLERRFFYLDELVSECCRIARPLAEEHGVSLAIESTPDGIEIEGDEGLMRRAVLNLVDNAVKYTEAGGAVRVAVSRDGDLARLDVTDTGIGIAPEELGRIFERFYRVDKARVRSVGGAGLGLSIVRWTVEEHGGSVTVQTEPGRGSTFTALLPIRSLAVVQ
jgi:heavy metal sensor kinase